MTHRDNYKTRKLGKKSQLALFITLGILFLLALTVVTFVALRDDSVRGGTGDVAKVDLDANTIIRTIESCVFLAEPTILEIVKNGGELNMSNDILYNGIHYNKWCLYSSINGCKNQIFSKPKLELEITKHIKPIIESCIDLSSYENQGYSITQGALSVETAVGPRDLIIYLTRPLTVRKGEFKFQQSQYSVKLDIPVGRVYDIANMILNEEIQYGYFDKDQWMKDYSAEIRINKHKTYPDTVYNLVKISNETKKRVELNFAIEGTDTISDFMNEKITTPENGLCKEGDTCFYNPESAKCSGYVSSLDECNDPLTDYYPICNGTDCAGCGLYTHGQEWCLYDGPTGEGMDFVGTRHYKKSCINGFIYTEECRDFREEMCVSDGSGTNAMCRPNRWKTCAGQTSQSTCEDDSKRDCSWIEYSSDFNKNNYNGDARIRCVPEVSPGFMWWANQGMEACQMNNEWMDCDGASCPQIWSETSMLQCKRLGDCGKYYTVGGNIGNLSFMTTDLYDHPDGPDTAILLPPEYLGNNYPDLTLSPFTYSKENFDESDFDCTDCTFDDMGDRVGEYIDWIESLDADDLLLEYALDGDISYHTRHFTLCYPFKSYEDGDCSTCFRGDIPCTEYRCRSTGNNCLFYIDNNGYGQCKERSTSPIPLTILDWTFDVAGYNIDSGDAYFATPDIKGKQISESVSSFSPIYVKFNTSSPAQCKKGLLPVSYQDFPFDLDFTISTPEAGFNIEHQFTIYALSSEYMLDDINTILDMADLIQMSDPAFIDQQLNILVYNLTSAVNTLYGTPGVSDSDLDDMLTRINETMDYYNDEIKPLMEDMYDTLDIYIQQYSIALTTDQAYTFFNCIDEYGNENEQDFFVTYFIAEDNNIPLPQPGTKIANNDYYHPTIDMEILMNEPVECKASFVGEDYLDMDYDMICDSGYYSFEDGFKCTLSLSKALNPYCDPFNNFGEIYYSCRDKIYLTNISESNISPPVSMTFKQNCSHSFI